MSEVQSLKVMAHMLALDYRLPERNDSVYFHEAMNNYTGEFDNSQQKDPGEAFLAPLLELAGANSVKTVSTISTVNDVHLRTLPTVVMPWVTVGLPFTKKKTDELSVQGLVNNMYKSETVSDFEVGNSRINVKRSTILTPLEDWVVIEIPRAQGSVTKSGQWRRKKLKHKVHIDDTIKFKNDNSNFHLTAITYHDGGVNSGHYLTRIKTVGGWYEFDDASVTQCESPQDDIIAQQNVVFLSYSKDNTLSRVPKPKDGIKNPGKLCYRNAMVQLILATPALRKLVAIDVVSLVRYMLSIDQLVSIENDPVVSSIARSIGVSVSNVLRRKSV